jgi:hypothetical protein
MDLHYWVVCEFTHVVDTLNLVILKSQSFVNPLNVHVCYNTICVEVEEKGLLME